MSRRRLSSILRYFISFTLPFMSFQFKRTDSIPSVIPDVVMFIMFVVYESHPSCLPLSFLFYLWNVLMCTVLRNPRYFTSIHYNRCRLCCTVDGLQVIIIISRRYVNVNIFEIGLLFSNFLLKILRNAEICLLKIWEMEKFYITPNFRVLLFTPNIKKC